MEWNGEETGMRKDTCCVSANARDSILTYAHGAYKTSRTAVSMIEAKTPEIPLPLLLDIQPP